MQVTEKGAGMGWCGMPSRIRQTWRNTIPPDEMTKQRISPQEGRAQTRQRTRRRLEQSLRSEGEQEGGQRTPGEGRGLHEFFQRDFSPCFRPKGISKNTLLARVKDGRCEGVLFGHDDDNLAQTCFRYPRITLSVTKPNFSYKFRAGMLSALTVRRIFFVEGADNIQSMPEAKAGLRQCRVRDDSAVPMKST